jgi:hypothetical protein
MTVGHPILTDFHQLCQQHYTCFALATGCVSNYVSEFAGGPPATLVFRSTELSNQVTTVARINIETLRDLGAPEGPFADTLAKAILVSLYAEWDEYYRPKYAKSIGIERNAVRSNLMGDLRLIRNCIVHAQSVITNEHKRCIVMPWPKQPGHLKITFKMMTEFFSWTNHLDVIIAPDSGTS